jgi:hypothetical protein
MLEGDHIIFFYIFLFGINGFFYKFFNYKIQIKYNSKRDEDNSFDNAILSPSFIFIS